MKLIKTILKIILVLVLLIIIGVVVFLVVISDNSKSDYKPSDSPESLETIIGKSIYDSLENISNIDRSERSLSEDNKIDIEFSYQDLNDCVTSLIRTNNAIGNPTYLMENGTTEIKSVTGASLSSVTFQEINGKLGCVARGSAVGFYHTSISMVLSEDPSILDNVLYLKLGEVKLGNKLNISANFVKGVFDRFNLFKDSDNELFDIKNLTMHLDLNKQLENFTDSTRFTDFLGNAKFSASYTAGSDAKLALTVDTKDIFITYDDIPEAPTTYAIDPALILGAENHSLTLSEENFNCLIMHEMDKSAFDLEPMSLGGYDYNFKLNNFYFDVNAHTSSSEVLAEVSINNLKTKVTANMKETLKKESNEVKEVILTVTDFKLGNVTIPNDNFFKEIVISEDALTQGHSDLLKVEDVIFDHENGEVKIVYAPNI